MSREENPTLKVLFDTGFAFSQAISRRMVLSEPILRSSRGGDGLDLANDEERGYNSAGVGRSLTESRSPKISGTTKASSLADTPRLLKTKVSGPATQLLNDFFAEIDQIDTSESIEASYVNVLLPRYRHARERARAGSRLRIKTSPSMNSPNIPDQPPTSPSLTHSLNQSFGYSRPHVNSEEDLQDLALRFQETHTENSEFINADAKFISNSLPNPRRRTFSNSSKVYDQDFRDVLKREKEILESSLGFVEEEDEDEKNAIEILEALFGELEDRENCSSEEEWKSAEEIIEDVKSKGGDKGKGKVVATEVAGDIGIEMAYNYSKDKNHHHNIDKPSEINFLNQAETEIRQYSALTQQNIESGSSSKKLDSLEKNVEDQAQLQSRMSNEDEVVPVSEFGEEEEEEKCTQPPEDIDLHKDFSPIKESQKISENSSTKQDQQDEDKCTNTSSSAKYHDTALADNQNVAADLFSKSTTITSIDNSSTTSSISTSTSRNDTYTMKEQKQKDPQFEMAALATGVLIASLWMIERRIRAF
ncbi:predicted protein [Sclerotinia sclerotiorum 1980 UF-70]|uniref:Uncharacterized protein n=2 Tax=Sclerotinia sclerotiorum (strain ATCC 18683 / 1980 / Ss-1) TaxID=665079 RepID=A7F8L7_SCLS1|nr:predicted protein [Sclerotinia sclerotiorum 1980 UF-70]APA13847.1 hypothetical protein sscle_11g086170 [Sclerotinia sclerotiorum 1980 UF-70]EDN99088.1 predicted protein [Sclerotinia sclerotiorum 1980 UF-70]